MVMFSVIGSGYMLVWCFIVCTMMDCMTFYLAVSVIKSKHIIRNMIYWTACPHRHIVFYGVVILFHEDAEWCHVLWRIVSAVVKYCAYSSVWAAISISRSLSFWERFMSRRCVEEQRADEFSITLYLHFFLNIFISYSLSLFLFYCSFALACRV